MSAQIIRFPKTCRVRTKNEERAISHQYRGLMADCAGMTPGRAWLIAQCAGKVLAKSRRY
jgi:hypothetical protein